MAQIPTAAERVAASGKVAKMPPTRAGSSRHGQSTASKDKSPTLSEAGAISDSELVLKVQQGAKADYQFLVERYQGRAFTVAYQILRSREDAQDVVQESFVKAYLSIGSFQGNSSFFTWFYRILVNMAIDLRRRSGRKDRVTSSLDNDEQTGLEQRVDQALVSPGDSPLEGVLRAERIQQIDKALGQISEDHRAVILLREVDGMQYEEIAETLGVSKGTVMSRLHYARKRVQQGLSDIWRKESQVLEEKVMNTNPSISSKQ